MTRIIAGEFAGRRLAVPQKGTRPTSDRVRESLFSILNGRGALAGARVLDLFAGSGALGFEALSRGAESLVAVDVARAATRILRENAAALGVDVEVHQSPAARFLRTAPRPFDLILVDPPYEEDIDPILELLNAGWAATGAAVVVERSSRTSPPLIPDGWEPWEDRRYGETTLWLAHAVS
ncbi:MAG: 16S rRNA (guanine(966)-N(2))-methyltransferase RsmD [Ruaniaceae bacterium]|nr:16S rRNA (guanine(966)-N(2))-methyltransferase RsmD [Ruaniaceae bacterium]